MCVSGTNFGRGRGSGPKTSVGAVLVGSPWRAGRNSVCVWVCGCLCVCVCGGVVVWVASLQKPFEGEVVPGTNELSLAPNVTVPDFSVKVNAFGAVNSTNSLILSLGWKTKSYLNSLGGIHPPYPPNKAAWSDPFW